MIEYDDTEYSDVSEARGLRPWCDVKPAEIAKLERARQCRDLAKLQTMLPAWIKAHQSTGNAAWRGFHWKATPEFSLSELEFRPGAPAKLPSLKTTKRAPLVRIPQIDPALGTAAYVAAFHEANLLKA